MMKEEEVGKGQRPRPGRPGGDRGPRSPLGRLREARRPPPRPAHWLPAPTPAPPGFPPAPGSPSAARDAALPTGLRTKAGPGGGSRHRPAGRSRRFT